MITKKSKRARDYLNSAWKNNFETIVERYFEDEQYQMRMHEQGYTQSDMEELGRQSTKNRNNVASSTERAHYRDQNSMASHTPLMNHVLGVNAHFRTFMFQGRIEKSFRQVIRRRLALPRCDGHHFHFYFHELTLLRLVSLTFFFLRVNSCYCLVV